MDLREYLFRNHMTQTEMSKRLFITRKYLADIIYAKNKPSMRLARDIERETAGVVTIDDVMSPWHVKPSESAEVCNG